MLWSITYRASDRTLTDEEVNRLREGLVERLKTALPIAMR
jgi:phenylalanyl-tRNA synthetase beta subunit